MLSDERRVEIWEQVADELYTENFDFSELEMECESELGDPRWGMPMCMSGGDADDQHFEGTVHIILETLDKHSVFIWKD